MAVGGLASGYFRLEQIERSAFEREGDKTGFRSAGVFLSGIPANAPSGCDRHALAVGAGDPAFARGHQEQLCISRRMRADKTTRLECQAGQVDLAITRCDARSEKSFAAEPSDVLFSAIELEDLHGPPLSQVIVMVGSVPRVLRRGVMIISLGAAPGRDESRDDASANRPPESFINGRVFTLKGLTLAR